MNGRMENMSIALVVIVVVLCCQPGGRLQTAQALVLRDICDNREVPIARVESVLNAIKELRANPRLCLRQYRQSFYELEPILTMKKGERICGDAKFKQIEKYHFRYINPKVEVYDSEKGPDGGVSLVAKPRPLTSDKIDYSVQVDAHDQEIMIPIALQQFFKAWALEVSGLCKRALAKNLQDAMLSQFDELDVKIYNSLRQAAQNGQKVGSPKSGGKQQQQPGPGADLFFGDLVYMPELEGPVAGINIVEYKATTMLDLTGDPEENLFFHACKLRFKPIYWQLLIPVERLAKLGYSYYGAYIDDIRRELDDDADTKKWKVLTAMCESMGAYELVESDDKAIQEMQELEYRPKQNYLVEGELWIKGSAALDEEFSKIQGEQASTGWTRFKYRLGLGTRKAVARMDPHRSAWYRRNQNTLSSSLNALSILSNTVCLGYSIVVSVLGTG